MLFLMMRRVDGDKEEDEVGRGGERGRSGREGRIGRRARDTEGGKQKAKNRQSQTN